MIAASSKYNEEPDFIKGKNTIMITPNQIKTWIEQGLLGSQAEVEGDGHHFTAVVRCSAFAGKNTLVQHRMVYDALGDKMQGEIHALSLKTIVS